MYALPSTWFPFVSKAKKNSLKIGSFLVRVEAVKDALPVPSVTWLYNCATLLTVPNYTCKANVLKEMFM